MDSTPINGFVPPLGLSPLERRREYTRWWQKTHPEHRKAYGKQWAAKNRDHCNAYARQWRKDHPEQKRVMDRRGRIRWEAKPGVKERRSERLRKYAAEHKPIHAARERVRRLRMGDKFPTQAVVKIYARAEELRKWFDVVVDHIIPLKKGGKHSADNLQIIQRMENYRKSAKLDFIPSIIFK